MTVENAITVYGTPGCNPCKLTKKFLDRNSIEYTYRDITEDEGALDAVHALGYLSVPVVVTQTAHFGGGYHPDKLSELAN